jgi:hypothetical protein
MAPASKVLALALAAACAGSASAASLAIPGWAYGLLPRNSNQDPAVVTELPPGINTFDFQSNIYFIRWCACVCAAMRCERCAWMRRR